jgi:hypothetical protein
VRAPKKVLHKLQFFVELLHGGVYGAEFVKQSQTPPKLNPYIEGFIHKGRLCNRLDQARKKGIYFPFPDPSSLTYLHLHSKVCP